MSLLSIFRIIALLEGVSYILLLFVATPIKYFADNPTYVRLLGMPHGLLFIAYIAIAVLLKPEQQWNKRTFLVILAASLIPFGTFYVDKKFLAPKK